MEEQSAKDTSSGGVMQPAKDNRDTPPRSHLLLGRVRRRVLSLLRRLSAPWVFNSFNAVILLGILFLLLLQPHWKKSNLITTALGIRENSLSPSVEPTDTIAESPPGQELLKDSEEQSDGTSITETDFGDIDKANELFEHKEYEQALTEYIKVEDYSVSSTDEDFVQYRLGECYQKLGRLNEALAAYRNITIEYFQSPYQVRAILREGECLIDKNDFLKARKLLFALVAQEAIYSDEDKGFVVEAYHKIAESYMKESLRYTHIQGYAFANEKQ
ncbi:MAG: tetratricopeptide repeat protein [Candidatus Brocadiales bacterium]